MADSITIYEKNIFPIFPTVIATAEIDCGDTIREYLDTVEMAYDVTEENKSNYGIVSKCTTILDSEVCKPFAEVIRHEALYLCQSIFAYHIDNLQFTQSWVSHKEPNQNHIRHSHPNSIISGVYYWQEGDLTPINFYKHDEAASINTIDIPMNKDVSKDQPLSWDTFTIKPAKGHLILFPSHLRHDVARNTSGSVRKSLAFNLMPTDSVGHPLRLTHFLFGKSK